jgi:DNA topoisomerase 2-associated protein PAT1
MPHMAFFGLPDNELPRVGPDEDLAVYTWGEDSYDGLGDALQEGGDDLNDETFGSVGTVGKDFNFSSTGLPDDRLQSQNRLQALPLSAPIQPSAILILFIS